VSASLVYDPVVATYRFGNGHPLRPERFTLAVSLMHGWGLLEPSLAPPDNALLAPVWTPSASTDDVLELGHDRDYVAAVKALGAQPGLANGRWGIGPGDTPAFLGMHDAGALAVGASVLALDAVLDDRVKRAFNPAGGMHHAQRSRASGFCIYNDCAVAIAKATGERPGLKVAYIDIDAHHGDGVEAAFANRSDVLTASIHESGQYIFPGTGAARDIGEGEGRGFAVNVPLPPGAGADELVLAFDRVVAPAVRAFAPDVIVAQLGGDSHAGDPLTHLQNTVAGHIALVRRIAGLADEVCGGRLAATGGGGYQPFTVVPRMWAAAMAVLLDSDVPDRVPPVWLEESVQTARIAGFSVPDDPSTYLATPVAGDEETLGMVRDLTERAIAEARVASPLIGD